ncbi:ArnT family glycosyltransferase [Flagellimonas pelagia]|uniref:Glycosyltransferase family 39 protein n=1 Tax=Flagellimonas pelagia TaxID=2306998 RepID=A0A3A1NIK0_9FLAO|nr:glycosyltransferase family 39 protein [Allomuricauda maritima]RIV43287.1 glycosyltransferase family 39 protein [Allomuricauda maritima]TXJ92514.1 glycosyltransferase family 39 protein [Allomuricauda maritima]
MKKYDSLLVFLFGLLMCTSFIGLYPIYILDEARNSEAAREMLVSDNYIVPFFNGQLRTDKPPLHYFFMVLGYKIFGVNAFGARFFSGCFGALTLLMTYWSVKRWFHPLVAKITVAVLMSSLFFVQEFHLAVPDPYLIFFVTLSLFSFYGFYKTQRISWLLPFYGGMALGILTKGPIAIVLPGLVIPIFLWMQKEFNLRNVLKLKPFLGLLLIILIAGPWYYLVHLNTEGAWTKGFFLDHNLSRFGSEKEGHGGLFLITPLYVLLGMLPFSVFLVQGFVRAWKVRKTNDFVLFSFLVSAITIVFFSISSTKLPNYPMPSYPFVAILIAFYLYQTYLEGKRTLALGLSLLFLMLIGILLPIGGWIGLSMEKSLFNLRYVSLFLILASITSLASSYFYLSGRFKTTFRLIAGGWIMMGLFLFGFIYPSLTQHSPVSKALEQLPSNADMVAFKRFDSAFPINFQRTFPVLDSLEEIHAYLKEHPDAFIITNTRKREDLQQLESLHLVMEQKALFENHITRIYTK